MNQQKKPGANITGSIKVISARRQGKHTTDITENGGGKILIRSGSIMLPIGKGKQPRGMTLRIYPSELIN